MKIINARMGSKLVALLSCVANAFGNAYVPLDAKAPEVNEVRTLKEVLENAKAIDAILAKSYATNKIEPLPLTDDATFVRRAHLQVGGRIPTYQETTGFLDSNDPQKHSDLIDRILNSEAYDSHTFNWWADLLRIQSPSRSGGANNVGGGLSYAIWMMNAIRQNIPFDEVARKLITAKGYPWNNGAVGYYMRDAGMPLDNMSNTTQVFLGTQMVCAQCHNHPFDKWTQMEYYQMAAYTYGVQARMGGEKQKEIQNAFFSQSKGSDAEKRKKAYKSKEGQLLRRAASEIMRPLRYGASHNPRKLQLPHDYQYEDAKPKTSISAAPIFGKSDKLDEETDPVEGYAQWMTSSENPRFSKVIANRLWKRVFGFGVIEPVDDIRDDTIPSNPELMAHLEKLMVSLNYDIKQFLRILYNVKAFRRETSTEEIVSGEPYHFPGPILQRMSAEQLWDSFVTLSIPYVDERKPDLSRHQSREEQLSAYEEKVYDLKGKEMLSVAKKGARMSKSSNDEMLGIQKKLRAAQENNELENVSRLRREYGQLRNKQRASYASLIMGKGFDGRALYGKAPISKSSSDLSPDRWKGFSRQLVRASYMPSPAPNGHFLREFGQSDREVIENASREASVPQALSLLNGSIYQAILKQPAAPFAEDLSRVDAIKDKVDILFLSILNRKPTKEELETCLDEIGRAKDETPDYSLRIPANISPEKKRKLLKYYAQRAKSKRSYGMNSGIRGLAWTLLNTRQFSFIQ
tara:strand:- start:34 stop:2268 length:2235 start_codon:yes stop_codon:yes gene_type:complete